MSDQISESPPGCRTCLFYVIFSSVDPQSLSAAVTSDNHCDNYKFLLDAQNAPRTVLPKRIALYPVSRTSSW